MTDRTQKELHEEAKALLAIEGNPLTEEDEQLFRMFDEKGFSAAQRIAYLKELHSPPVPISAE